ncbi:MAG: VWA domain-containing protein [Bdellovibrionales bacterium]|nr:VWA domain-containing protein [Bdellovibrionales bacterium]
MGQNMLNRGIGLNLWVLVFIVYNAVFFIGCSDVSLVTPEEPKVVVKSSGGFCISDPDEVQRFTKFLFVIDKSGSNSSTDNGAQKRAGNIRKFINENKEKKYYRYGLIVFSGSHSDSFINDAKGNAEFTSDINKTQRAVERLETEGDSGSTPYKAALGLTRNIIVTDAKKYPKEKSIYMVFFISDGVPTDGSNSSELSSLVKDIRGSVTNKVFVSTAFYGGSGSGAEDRLQDMAQAGKGKYINFDRQKDWDFNELVVRPDYEPWQLKTLMVYNINAGYCIDGTIDTDSDGDGMCDKDEINMARFGFDPQNRFSFGGGYGDYFHWLRVKHKKDLPACDDRSDEDLDLLTFCEEAFIENESPNAPPDLLSGNPLNPDTDRDGIIDGIETFVFFTRTRAFAMDPNNLSSVQYDFEEQAGEQIYQHRNPLVRDKDQVAYDSEYWPETNFNNSKTCYGFHMSQLPLYNTLEVLPKNTLPGLAHGADENIVLLYYLQTYQDSPNGDAVYKYSYQNLKKNGLRTDTLAGLKVRDEVFSTFVP